MAFYNDRRPAVAGDHEWATLNQAPLDRDGLRAANARLRAAAPAYRQDDVNRQIRTTAVQRHRARQAGHGDYATVGGYLSFMTGAGSDSH